MPAGTVERTTIEVALRDLASRPMRDLGRETDQVMRGIQSSTGRTQQSTNEWEKALRQVDTALRRLEKASSQGIGRVRFETEESRSAMRQFEDQLRRNQTAMRDLGKAAGEANQRLGEALRDVPDVDGRGQRAGSGFSSGFAKGIAGIAGLVGAALAGVSLFSYGKESVGLASDTQEASTKLEAIFGDATSAVNQFAEQGPKALGQTSLAVKDAAATFGVFGKAAGLAGQENAEFADGLAGLSTDLASFYNADPSQVIEALGAGLRGEAEPLRQFGILMDDATMRQEALKLGLISTTKDALTPAQKVLAAHALIMEQTTLAQGDFARTSSGLANQQRILTATWQEGKATIGQVFLPAVTDVTTALNNRLAPALEAVTPKVHDFVALMNGDSADGGALANTRLGWLASQIYAFQEGGLANLDIPKLQAFVTLMRDGDFTGALGVQEDHPLVSLLLTLRGGALSTWESFGTIWGEIKTAAIDLRQPLFDIASSLAQAGASLGVSAWQLFLTTAELLATSLNAVLVPALTWISEFMRDNPAVVTVLVGAWATYKTIILAVTAAAKLYTLAQLALNVAMRANPVMILVTALAALVAAVVWAYNNVEWFRNAVDWAWDKISTAAKWAWENVLQPVFQWIGEAAVWVGDKAVWLWQNAIVPAWNGISSAASWAWDNVLQPVFSAIGSGIETVGGFFTGLWDTAQQVWTWIGDKIQWVFDNVISPVWDNVKSFAESVGGFFKAIGEGIQDAWTWIQDTGEKIKNFVQGIVEFFTPSGAGNSPTTSVSGIDVNNGGSSPSYVGSWGAYEPHADGGLLTGPGGPRQDLLPILASNGEFMVNAASTAKYRPLLETINADRMPAGYADGGMIAAGRTGARDRIVRSAADYYDVTYPMTQSGGTPYTGPISGGVEQWRPTVLQALALTGQSAALADTVLHQMDTESSGNPNAINLWDSNAAKGTPSIGLMQVIQPTFDSYALPGHNANIYDPLSNIIAAIRYTIDRYGGVAAGMQGHAYDNGGWMKHLGFGFNATGRPEAVLNPEESAGLIAMANYGAFDWKGKDGKDAHVVVNVGGITVNGAISAADLADLRDEVEEIFRDIASDQMARSY